METAVMAKAQSWRGPDTRQSNYSEDFTLRELGGSFVSELEKTVWYFLQILPFSS